MLKPRYETGLMTVGQFLGRCGKWDVWYRKDVDGVYCLKSHYNPISYTFVLKHLTYSETEKETLQTFVRLFKPD